MQAPQGSKVDLPDDPVAGLGLAGYARALRAGRTTCEATVRAYLRRIDILNPRLDAYSALNGKAVEQAIDIDRRVAEGSDSGPLMGVPIALKQIFSAEGLPANPATDLDVDDLIPEEGPFVRSLKRAGAIILGLTRTTEFAGGTINTTKPMPWNPWDATVKRLCGGSSHGSAVAQAAGMCAAAIGSDTGGSVRLPGALCGVAAFKPTQGILSTDGVFPLSPTFDTVGFFGASVQDIAILAAVSGAAKAGASRAVDTLRLACPTQFLVDVDPAVHSAFDRACNRLLAAGAKIELIDLPDVDQVAPIFGRLLAAELIAYLGRERVTAAADKLDPVVWTRLQPELQTTADDMARLRKAHRDLVSAAARKIQGFDAVIGPTTPYLPSPAREWSTAEAAITWNCVSGAHTRPGNLFGWCGVSLPVHRQSELPVGFQVMAGANEDLNLLAIAGCIEAALGLAPVPDLRPFINM